MTLTSEAYKMAVKLMANITKNTETHCFATRGYKIAMVKESTRSYCEKVCPWRKDESCDVMSYQQYILQGTKNDR